LIDQASAGKKRHPGKTRPRGIRYRSSLARESADCSAKRAVVRAKDQQMTTRRQFSDKPFAAQPPIEDGKWFVNQEVTTYSG